MTANDKFTSGPYEAIGSIVRQERRPLAPGFMVAECHGFEIVGSDEERWANAKLLAASWDMLQALRIQVANIEHWIETGEPAGPEESKDIYDRMVAAIRKAEGGL